MKPQTINSFWRKPCPDILYDFTEFMRVDQGNNKKRLWIWQKKKVRGKLFQDMDLREIQVLVGTKLEELTEDDSIEMSALDPEPDDEEEDIEEAEPRSRARKQIDIRQSGNVLIVQDCFGLL